ncbi:MAG: hypothetical protein AB1458_10430 [Bacteroidota bacterium]
MDIEFEKEWNALVRKLSDQFNAELDEQGVLFLIGVQELGKGYRQFSKDQKLEVIHIAICTLLAPYGYYEYEGMDAEGWPHWRSTAKLPHLKPMQQSRLIKEAILDYFRKSDAVN